MTSIDITKTLVRLSFVPMMSEDRFLESLDRLLRVLDGGPSTAFRSGCTADELGAHDFEEGKQRSARAADRGPR